jgi:endonuclease/exonuclease/phosphatase family metal-dependent hydrolase
MKMVLKLIIVCILCLLIAGILYFLGVLIYASLTEFKPEPVTGIPLEPQNNNPIPAQRELNLLTWNIGYAGLGKEMDFFYEGGRQVRASETQTKKYLDGIKNFIRSIDSADFLLLQEVDFKSKRSYGINEEIELMNVLSGFTATSVLNYDVNYVPIPFLNPMGKVKSGLLSMGKFSPMESTRISTPGTYSWPKRLFMLKRCLLQTSYKTENDHELVLFNIHNSAYDDADALRDEELKLIRSLAIDEYQKGNYVIIGGDWNQNPPRLALPANSYKVKSLRPISANLMPEGWKWAYDTRLPTNRDVDKPFDKATSICSMIDFFLVSPNIELLEVKTVDLEFENSDHLPVLMKVILKD